MVLLLKFLHLLETNNYLDKYLKRKNISKCSKKISFFSDTISEKEILPKNKWIKKFDQYWCPSEENALKELNSFIRNRIDEYSESRNFPSIVGTSKLSPYIKHGQIHVETIWNECNKIKKKRCW